MECVRFASKNNFLTIGRVGFASKIISLLSNVFASLDMEKNTIMEAFVRFCFDIVAITIYNTAPWA